MVYEEKTIEYVMFWVVSKAQDWRGPAPGVRKDPEGLLWRESRAVIADIADHGVEEGKSRGRTKTR